MQYPSSTEIDSINDEIYERMPEVDPHSECDNPEWDDVIKGVLREFGYDTEVAKDDYRAVYRNGVYVYVNVWFSNSYNAQVGVDDNFDGLDDDE